MRVGLDLVQRSRGTFSVQERGDEISSTAATSRHRGSRSVARGARAVRLTVGASAQPLSPATIRLTPAQPTSDQSIRVTVDAGTNERVVQGGSIMTRLTGPAIRVFALLRCDQLTHPALVFHQDLSPLSPGQYVVEYWAAHYYRGFEPILLRATTTLTVTPGTTVAEVPAVGQVGLMILAAAIAGAAASILRGTNRGLLPRGGGSRSLPIR